MLVFYRAFADFRDSTLPPGIGETERIASRASVDRLKGPSRGPESKPESRPESRLSGDWRFHRSLILNSGILSQKTFLWLYFVIFVGLWWWLHGGRRRSNRRSTMRSSGWRFFFTVGGVIVRIIKSSEFFESGEISNGKIFCCCVQSLNLLEMLIFFRLKNKFLIRYISKITVLPSKRGTMLLHQR